LLSCLKIIQSNGKSKTVETPGVFPASTKYCTILEPMVEASIITPGDYLGAILTLAKVRPLHFVLN
jgi:GTP-binding protein LepA